MKKGFNLLKIQAEPPSAWTKIYDWVIGTARVVIIVVEMIVLVAFGIRIYIDVQGKDLDSKVGQSEAILDVMKTSESRFRLIQARTDMFKTIWNNSPDYTDVLANINSLLPISTSIKDLTITINNEQVAISGVAPKSKDQEVRDLEANLKNNSTYLKDALLSKLDDSPEQLKFLFTAKLINMHNKDINKIVTDGTPKQ